jgi:diguanylate cyclase (GGDEF)-like protein
MRYIRSQQELQEARDRLEEISLRDALTGVANRRSFDQTLEAEWSRATRTRHPLALLLIDLDYFKNLNDTQGHRYGDRCLSAIARVLREVASRSGDMVARYGGEEFAVILPTTTQEAALGLAMQMQEAVADLLIENQTSIGRYVSISIGIAGYCYPEPGTPAMLVEASDQALYLAKKNGRNRIETSSMAELMRPSLLSEM